MHANTRRSDPQYLTRDGRPAPAPYRTEPAGVERASDVSPARWIQDRLWEWGRGLGFRVGSLVPEGFEAYARVLHPAYDRETATHRVPWREIAAATGRTVHPEVSFTRLGGPEWSAGRPCEGTLEPRECLALLAELAGRTTTPGRAWFLIWSGFGDLAPWPHNLVRTQGREYRLYRGPVAAAAGFASARFGHSPNLWWPDDRAWCVASEIDAVSTGIGGSRECIDALLASPALEALEVSLEHRLDIRGDTINPPSPDELP